MNKDVDGDKVDNMFCKLMLELLHAFVFPKIETQVGIPLFYIHGPGQSQSDQASMWKGCQTVSCSIHYKLFLGGAMGSHDNPVLEAFSGQRSFRCMPGLVQLVRIWDNKGGTHPTYPTSHHSQSVYIHGQYPGFLAFYDFPSVIQYIILS